MSRLKLVAILCALSVVSRCQAVGLSAVKGILPFVSRLIISEDKNDWTCHA